MTEVTKSDGRGKTVSAATLRIEVISGPATGETTLLDSDTISVGSADGNALVIADPTVSRFHLELVREPTAIRVTDLQSTNGTFVGNVRLVHGHIQPGTVLRIGGSEIRIVEGNAIHVHVHDGALAGLRGTSQAMQRLMATIERAARGAASILITGESGVGKEVTANAIHALGDRASAPFLTVDCGAIAPQLLTSELFGHERGSFTGADRQHLGAFERANGGTVFLDEIGELGLDVQANLLGVLERRRFRRVGGRTDIALDVRVIAATHRDLRSEVNAGRFRLDLYYRLAVVVLAIPALRERPEDIVPLVDHFLAEFGSTEDARARFGDATLAALVARTWPGNVRELRNFVESALLLGDDSHVPSRQPAVPVDAAVDLELDRPYRQARADVTLDFERRYLRRLLARAQNNVSRAARMSEMDRSHLTELLRKHRLRGES